MQEAKPINENTSEKSERNTAADSKISENSDAVHNGEIDTEALASHHSIVGSKVGDRYEIVSVIASGGMGVVYQARHTLMNKIVAIKMLHSAYMHEQSALDRFLREAKIACQLSHPNIVVVHDFALTSDKKLYLVMDYVEGQTLEQILGGKKSLPVEELISIICQVCDGLTHAHDLGLIHRDLKPANIMITCDKSNKKQVKILDFGLAKALGEGREKGLSDTGIALGTCYYMSPEQCCGKQADVRSEIYALGCVMFEAITGMPPFRGANVLEVMQKHIRELARNMSELRSDITIPESIEKIVSKAMAKDPQQRFQSAADLKAALLSMNESTAKKTEKAKDCLELQSIIAETPVVEEESEIVSEAEIKSRSTSLLLSRARRSSAQQADSTIVLIILVFFALFGVGSLFLIVPYFMHTAEMTELGRKSAAETPSWKNHANQGQFAFDKNEFARAEILLKWAVIEAREANSKEGQLLTLRRLADVLYVEQKFKDADLIEQQIHQLATNTSTPNTASASAPTPTGTVDASNSVAGVATTPTAITKKHLTESTSDSMEAQDDHIAHLALVCHKNGQCDTAVSLLQHSVEIAKKMYGPNSLKTAERMSQLASMYLALDQQDKAQPLIDQVMEIKAAQKTSVNDSK